ncbi:4-hydroxybenzoate 3-monooxygenase [Streptomyces roseoverticillatus]|uniref:4-hydroxybenzoate 3-monooxygenase n=1 Tax=Streptomyces roseoverticillatus TaxID=66429 RepID=UPI001EF3512B|nr:4-hydroxybenzoate 3-monooxygenase [Streptomyces roseoverticillatus]MCF3101810.1 4-hydroxybenzoate 3-monooxygenase [Streptomyces roseoverticillatus]
MTTAHERTTVVIVGAGVAGLTLGNFLLRSGIDCVILEKRSREYVEQRQRAGVIDTRAARMFREWALEDRVIGGVPVEPVLNFRLDGETRRLALAPDDHHDGRFCPQQVLVRNLIDVFTGDGGDLRFDADDLSLHNIADETLPHVRYRERTGSTKVISCAFVAGCDGDRGASRAAIPGESLTRHSYEYGYAWLTVLAEVPANHQSMMALHPRGFAGQFARGPHASRFYLQCPLDSSLPRWTDEQIWDELETRFGDPMTTRGRITSTQLVPLRSVVYSPMSHGRLYLLGDSAHIVPPMSAKGMNLALYDAEVFAKAVIHHQVNDQDSALLDAYSSTCLRHVWNYQAFAAWWTELIHNAGDSSYQGEFRHRVARADLARLFEAGSANRLLSEFIAGLN